MKYTERILTLFVAVGAAALAVRAADRPNLLFIMMDDLGFGQCQFNNDELTVDQFDPYLMQLVAQRQGYDPQQALEFSRRAMPTLNRLAREGVMFSRAYSPSNLCAPARISVATGKTQQRRGIYINLDVEELGPAPGSLLAERLQASGYATAHIGKWHIGRRDDSMIRQALARRGIHEKLSFSEVRSKYPDIYDELWEAGYYGSVVPEQNPLRNGFDYYYGYNNWASEFYNSPLVWEGFRHAGRQSGYNTEVFTDKALAFMQEQVMREKPFFVQLHFHAVHGNLRPNAPEKYFRVFSSYNYDLTNFYAHVYAVDESIRRILDYLDGAGQLENTLIVFTSDNGGMVGGPSVLPGNAPFSGHKGNFLQGGVRVPLFFWWPAGAQRSRVLDTLASSIDIMPTLLDAAGIKVPDGLDGQSLLGLISGRSAVEVHKNLVWAGIHARRWGFLINTSFENHWTEGMRPPPAWAVVQGNYLLRFVGTIEPHLYHEYPDGQGPTLKLFDIRNDPTERNDIAADHPEVVRELKQVYLEASRDYEPPVHWPREKWEEIAGYGKR